MDLVKKKKTLKHINMLNMLKMVEEICEHDGKKHQIELLKSK